MVQNVKHQDLPFDVFCIVGSKGTGKSSLCNRLFQTKFKENSKPRHVTKEQQEQEVGSLMIIDTVGFDFNPNNFLSLSKYQGNKICLVYLNNDLRVETSVKSVAQKLGIHVEEINVVNAFYLNAELLPDYPSAAKLTLTDLASFKTFLHRKPAHGPPVLHKPKNPKQRWPWHCIRPEMLERFQMFPTDKQPLPHLFDLYAADLTLDLVRSYRQRGDCLLKFFVRQYLAPPSVDDRADPAAAAASHQLSLLPETDFISNFQMKRFLRAAAPPNCRFDSRLRELYPGQADQLNDQSCGDIVEALFFHLFANKRRHFLCFLDGFLTFCVKAVF